MEILLLEPFLNKVSDGEPCMPTRRPSAPLELDDDEIDFISTAVGKSVTRFHSNDVRLRQFDERPRAARYRSDTSDLKKLVRRPTIEALESNTLPLVLKNSVADCNNGRNRRPPVRTISTNKDSSLLAFSSLDRTEARLHGMTRPGDVSHDGVKTSAVERDVAGTTLSDQSPRGVETVQLSLIKAVWDNDSSSFASLSSALTVDFDDDFADI